MTPPEFSNGRVVRHRTSLELGVLCEVTTTCVNPDHAGPVGCLAAKLVGCVPEPYRLLASYGMGRRERLYPCEVEPAPEPARD